MPVVEEVVPDAMTGERLDRFVATVIDCSRSVAARLIEDGRIEVNGRVQPARSVKVDAGATITIDYDDAADAPTTEPDPSVPIAVVFEDDQLIVVNKQDGLVVHPGAGTPDGTLANGLLARYPELATVGQPDRPGIVHRLDRGTTGLLVVARTPQTYDALVQALSEREITREYDAVVWGHVEHERGVVDAAIARSQKHRTRMAVSSDGRPARTHYEVIDRSRDEQELSLVRCRLETGRTHQIRVHMQAIGHAIVGDETYGGRRDALSFGRPALHAARLAFDHPVTGELLQFDAERPEDMTTLIAEVFGS